MGMVMKKIKINDKEILIFDDLLSYAARASLYTFIVKSLFKTDGSDNEYAEDAGGYNIYSAYSIRDLEAMKFLDIPEMKEVLKHVEGYKIDQIRVNLSTLNDKNHFHTDYVGTNVTSKNVLNKSLIYYPNMKWNIEWGGHTLFANENMTEIEYCSLYTPGRIILFDGSIPHCILPPTNLAPAYRYSFVIQYNKSI
jgi:hypothetical protein